METDNDCQKRCFTKPEAIKAIENNKTGKQYRKEVRCYFCYFCGCWHLTSKEKTVEPQTVRLLFYNKWKKLFKNNK